MGLSLKIIENKFGGLKMIEYGQPTFLVNGFAEMTTEQARKAFSLIRAECCNYELGNCKMLVDDTDSKCKQLKNRAIFCSWFKEAVLPLNKGLEVSILNSDGNENEKTCAECGKSFLPKNNKQKYCIRCIPKIIRKQNLVRQQKRRLLSRNRTTL
jgi:hypothetical protein